jgi:hypothetical protein
MRGVVLSLLSLTFFAPVIARADGDPVTAEALFREGRRAADAGNYTVACPRFAESYRLDPEPGTLLNLGDCEENRGQLAHAWEHFRQLYDELPQADERRPIADARARALELRLPKLRIVLLTSPARITRDDEVLGNASLGVSLPVDPGHHVMVVSSRGRRDKRYDVVLAEGDDKVVSVSSGEPMDGSPPLTVEGLPSGVQPAAVTEHPTSGWSVTHTAVFVVGGVGVVSLVTGSVFGVVALTHLSSANAGCSGNVCSSPNALDQFRDAQSFAVATDLMLGIGVALIGTAVVLALYSSHHRSVGQAHIPLWIEGRF